MKILLHIINYASFGTILSGQHDHNIHCLFSIMSNLQYHSKYLFYINLSEKMQLVNNIQHIYAQILKIA